MKPAKHTLHSVSRDLGLSISTVSKALNNYPDVSEAIRLQVKLHAQKIDFTPRPKVSRVANIALCISWGQGFEFGLPSYIMQIEEGMATYLWRSGLELSVYGGPLERLNEEDITRELTKRKIDGVVVVNGNRRASFLDRLIQHQFPLICVLSNGGRDTCSLLAVDNELIGYLGTQHLVRLGHQGIAVLVQSPNSSPAIKRIDGYLRAINEAGLNVQKDFMVNAESEDVDPFLFGNDSVRKLFGLKQPPTAIFCLNYESAIGAMHAARNRGLKIPQDLSIIACDDFPETPYLAPPLTTVKIPNRQIGQDAAAYVHRRISDKTFDAIENRIVSPELIVRESTGPASVRGEKK